MTIYCPECEQSLPASDINRKDALAICDRCDVVFDIRAQLMAGDATTRALMQVPRARVPMPVGVGVHRPEAPAADAISPFRVAGRARSEVVVTMPAFHRGHGAVGVLAAIAAAYVAFGVWQFGFALMTVAHIALGCGLAAYAIAGKLNRVEVAVVGDALEVRHGPVPTWRVRRLPVDAIDQIYCKKRRVDSWRSGNTWAFEVLARMRGGGVEQLVRRLDRRDQALYVEQVLEDAMLITDVPVVGELRGQ